MTNKLDVNGLNHVLQSIHQKMAHEARSVFKTDPAWEAPSLTVLRGWVSGATATDTINDRTINNYDVYAVQSPKKQYYFDSGDWFLFTPDLTDYYTKAESDARYANPSVITDESLTGDGTSEHPLGVVPTGMIPAPTQTFSGTFSECQDFIETLFLIDGDITINVTGETPMLDPSSVFEGFTIERKIGGRITINLPNGLGSNRWAGTIDAIIIRDCTSRIAINAPWANRIHVNSLEIVNCSMVAPSMLVCKTITVSGHSSVILAPCTAHTLSVSEHARVELNENSGAVRYVGRGNIVRPPNGTLMGNFNEFQGFILDNHPTKVVDSFARVPKLEPVPVMLAPLVTGRTLPYCTLLQFDESVGIPTETCTIAFDDNATTVNRTQWLEFHTTPGNCWVEDRFGRTDFCVNGVWGTKSYPFVSTSQLTYRPALLVGNVDSVFEQLRINWDWTGLQQKTPLFDAPSDGKQYVRQNEQWSELDSSKLSEGKDIVDRLDSAAADKSLSANQGRVLKEMIAAQSDEPLSTADINSVLVAAGFPSIIGE